MTITNTTPDDERRKLIAAILGEDEMHLVKWQDLMREGVIVRLRIKRVRFKQRWDFRDFGISFPDEKTEQQMRRLFSGSKTLLPERYLKKDKVAGKGGLETIESGARKLLKRLSFDTVWGSFLPAKVYVEQWQPQIEEVIAEYYALRDEIIAHYPKIVKEMERAYTAAARNAYRILRATQIEHLTAEEAKNESYKEARYVIGVRRDIRRALPTVEEIRESFSFEILRTYIDLPDLVSQELPLTDTSPEVRQWEIQHEAEEGYRRDLAQMHRDVLLHAREQKERLVDEWLTGIVTQLRALVYEASINVLGALRSGAGLQPRSVVQLRTMLEQLSSLNFYHDRDIDRMSAMVSDLLNQRAEDRSLTDIEACLAQVATVTRSTLLSLNYAFTHDQREEREDQEALARAQIAAAPSRQDVREAREYLGLPLSDALLPTYTREERPEEEGLALPRHAETLPPTREEREW